VEKQEEQEEQEEQERVLPACHSSETAPTLLQQPRQLLTTLAAVFQLEESCGSGKSRFWSPAIIIIDQRQLFKGSVKIIGDHHRQLQATSAGVSGPAERHASR